MGKKVPRSETVSIINYRKHCFYPNGAKKPPQEEGGAEKPSDGVPHQPPELAIPDT